MPPLPHLFRFVSAAVWLIAANGLLADERVQLDFFEKQVRPLLVERCLECHSAGSDDIGGNLLLDSRSGWMTGGDLGPAIKPGDPESSLLLRAVRYESDELRMPPDGRLSRHEIGILEKWIAMGAPDPRQGKAVKRQPIDLAEGRKFWAFQPHHQREIPIPAEPPGFESFNELDRFLFRQQARKQLQPEPLASRRELIRRVTLGLTGLLPSPDETDSFVNDTSPAAYQRLVDRLLASPRYGEMWGRYWLDVARYADSNGLDENIAHGNAWRFRDYVIRSFNADKPYSLFIQEQLAGDLLDDSPAADHEQRTDRLIATGFLSLGPKVLAEVDERKMEMDIVDEQVDTVGRALLGLTLGCARCHDHKFDPIRTDDYYALAGIFKSTRTMEHFTKIARWNEVSLATEAQRQQRTAQDQQLAKLREEMKQLQAAGQKPEPAPSDQAGTSTALDPAARIAELQKQIQQLEDQLIELPHAMGVQDRETPEDVPVHIRGSHLTLGTTVPRGFPAVLAGSEPREFADSGRKELAQWLASGEHPLVARVIVNRIWRWHFGRGIVATTDNFGQLGERPSHPELLDWLANRFIEDGWSIKNLNRLIVTSATYQRSSNASAENRKIDPENRSFGRWGIRRMRAEVLRDAMLQTAGILDLRMGGSQLHVKNREFLFDHTSRDLTNYDALTRSIYLPVIRNHLYDLFQLFDYTDASVTDSDRDSTTIPSQALFLMNSPFMRKASEAFAQRLLIPSDLTTAHLTEASSIETSSSHVPTGDGEHDAARLTLGYRLAFSRSPTADELQRDLRFLQQLQQSGLDRQEAWRQWCQVILMSNEFVYIR